MSPDWKYFHYPLTGNLVGSPQNLYPASLIRCDSLREKKLISIQKGNKRLILISSLVVADFALVVVGKMFLATRTLLYISVYWLELYSCSLLH